MSAVVRGNSSAEIGIEIQCRAAPAEGEIRNIQYRGGHPAGLGGPTANIADNAMLVATANLFNFISFLPI